MRESHTHLVLKNCLIYVWIFIKNFIKIFYHIATGHIIANSQEKNFFKALPRTTSHLSLEDKHLDTNRNINCVSGWSTLSSTIWKIEIKFNIFLERKKIFGSNSYCIKEVQLHTHTHTHFESENTSIVNLFNI